MNLPRSLPEVCRPSGSSRRKPRGGSTAHLKSSEKFPRGLREGSENRGVVVRRARRCVHKPLPARSGCCGVQPAAAGDARPGARARAARCCDLLLPLGDDDRLSAWPGELAPVHSCRCEETLFTARPSARPGELAQVRRVVDERAYSWPSAVRHPASERGREEMPASAALPVVDRRQHRQHRRLGA